MKKVIVTGATGFIGRQTLPKLLSLGYEVYGVSNREPTMQSPNLHWHQNNLLDIKEISSLVAEIKPSHLLHFAWDATPGKFWNSLANLDWVKASIHLIQEFAAHGGKRIVISGTCAEYEDSELCKELSTPLKPSTLYGICKASLFKMLEAYAAQVGLSQAWGRVFFLYGPHEYEQRLVPSIINNLLNKQIAKCSHGMQVRDFMHVEDVADAFVKLLDSEIQGPVNIASGEKMTLKDVITTIGRKFDAMDLIQFGAHTPPPNEPPIILADVNRLSKELSWTPKYSLDEGIDQTISWWKNAK